MAKRRKTTWYSKLIAKGKKKNGETDYLKLALCVGLVVLLVVGIVNVWRNRVDLSCANVAQCSRDSARLSGRGKGFPLTLSGSKVEQTEKLLGGVAVLTDTELQVYTSSSKQAMGAAHFMSNPMLKTCGRYAVLADIGNRMARLESVSGTIDTVKTDNPIISCAVSGAGDYAVVMQGSSYNSAMLSSVEVLNRKGEQLHLWHSSDYYITEAALSTDGRYLAMCGAAAKDGVMSSELIVHRVGTNEDHVRISCPETLLIEVGFTASGTIFAIGDERAYIISADGEKQQVLEYEGELMAYDIDADSGAALFISKVPNKDSGDLYVYDTRGQLRFCENVAQHCIGVALSESGCAALGRGRVACLRLNGRTMGEWETGANSSNIQMIDKTVYVVDGLSLAQVQLKTGTAIENNADEDNTNSK